MASQRQVSANRQNGLKGGVKTEEGKLISRLNARKHGIFASALTSEDSEDLYGIEDELVAALRPVGPLEEMLVEKIALTYLRMQRCARAEAEFHENTWDGQKGIFREGTFANMVKLIDLYDSRLTNQFLKLTREIERLQRLRADEDSPWPACPPGASAAADVAAKTDAEGARDEAPPEAVVPKAPMTRIPPITPAPPAPTAAGLKGPLTEAEVIKMGYRLRAEAERAEKMSQTLEGQEDHDPTSV